MPRATLGAGGNRLRTQYVEGLWERTVRRATPRWPHSGDANMDADVAIVGAGFAGLAAARELRWPGRSAIVLEARDRIGGRTWTDDRLGTSLELGGTWVHWVQPQGPVKWPLQGCDQQLWKVDRFPVEGWIRAGQRVSGTTPHTHSVTRLPLLGIAHADMVQPRAVAQRDLAALVDPVAPDPHAGSHADLRTRGPRLVPGVERGSRRSASDRLVGPDLAVVGGEPVWS